MSWLRRKAEAPVRAAVPTWDVVIDDAPDMTLAEAKVHVYETYFGENGDPLASISPAVIRGGGQFAVAEVMHHMKECSKDEEITVAGKHQFISNILPHSDPGKRFRLTAHRTFEGIAEGIVMDGITIETDLLPQWENIRMALLSNKVLRSTNRPQKVTRIVASNNDVILFDHRTPHAFTNLTSERTSDGKWTMS